MGEIEEKIGKLEKEGNKLIEEIRRINGRLGYKSYEEKAIEPYLKRKEEVRPGRLYRALDDVEFRIATEAYTPKIEKEMIKEAKKIKEGLKEAVVVGKMRKRQSFIRRDIKKLEEERKGVEKRLDEVRKRLRDLYDEKRKREREKMDEKRREEKKKREKRKWKDYMKPVDKFVSLEEICIIEKEE